MKLYINGDINEYYVQTLCMIFFPGEKFSETENLSGRTLSVSLTENGDTYVCRVSMFDGNNTVDAERKLINGSGQYTPVRARKIVVGRAVFTAGEKLLGITPPWGILTGVRPTKVPTEQLSGGLTPARTRTFLQNEYFLNPKKATLVTTIAANEIKMTKKYTGKLCSVYISIPFCPSRCAYCSFVSYTNEKLLSLIDDYLAELCRNIDDVFAAAKASGYTVATVYIGGGTPTVLDSIQLSALLDRIGKNTDTSALLEYTLEAGRPDTIDAEKLRIALEHGVTRVSVNPQSLSDIVLRSIGRGHTARDFYRAYDIAKKSGIPTINVDLIAGLPNDNFKRFSRTVDKVVSLDPENITVHTFCVKKAADILREKTDVYCADGGVAGKCVDYSQVKIGNSGYKPYYMYRQKNTVGNLENVGFTKDGHEGLYNIFMMEELHTVFAAGAGAVTKLVSRPPFGTEGKTVIKRIFNDKYPYEYLRDAKNTEKASRFDSLMQSIDEFEHAVSGDTADDKSKTQL